MISVVIPTLGRPRLLKRAVSSVLAQSVTDIELLVVVDGIDLDTTAVLADIDDPRIRVLQNERSLGSAGARNEGIKSGRGEWIAFLDDDDEWTADKLSLQLALARATPGSVVVSCLSFVITPLHTYIWPTRAFNNDCAIDEYLFDRRTLFRGESMLQCSSLFMPKQLALELLFRPVHDDWDLLLRAAKMKGARILTVDKPLVYHYTEDDRKSLGGTFNWRNSLDWADRNRSLVNDRAYAGFCLNVIAPQAAKSRDYTAFFILLWRALCRGSPRLIQIMLFLAMWIIPMRCRQQLRSIWSYCPLSAQRRLTHPL